MPFIPVKDTEEVFKHPESESQYFILFYSSVGVETWVNNGFKELEQAIKFMEGISPIYKPFIVKKLVPLE